MSAPTNLKEKGRRQAGASGPKLGPRPATRDHLVSGKKPLTVSVQVVRDNDLVYSWRRRHADFPAPIARLRIGFVWSWPDVERWARKTGRLT